MPKKIRKAVIPIAGLGSRFLPVTKCVPKEMLPLFDRPVIEHIVRELADAGVEEIIFVVPPEGSITPNHFFRNPFLETELLKKGKPEIAAKIRELSTLVKIATVVQQEPRGDGHAIFQAADLVGNEDFFAFFGDEILDAEKSAAAQLLSARDAENVGILGLQKIKKSETKKFGIVTPKEKNPEDIFEIVDFVEKPAPENAPSDLALVGKNICPAEIFDALKSAKPGPDGEIRLIDAFSILQKSGRKICGKVLRGARFDVGNPTGLLAASNFFAQKKKF